MFSRVCFAARVWLCVSEKPLSLLLLLLDRLAVVAGKLRLHQSGGLFLLYLNILGTRNKYFYAAPLHTHPLANMYDVDRIDRQTNYFHFKMLSPVEQTNHSRPDLYTESSTATRSRSLYLRVN